MSTDVEKLENLQQRLRSARALLPQMIRKVAFASDDASNVQLFKGVAQDLTEWQATSEALEAEYLELKPLMDKLNGVEEPSSQNPNGQNDPQLNNKVAGAEFYDLTQ